MLKAFALGIIDGYRQGELTIGVTFDDDPTSPRSVAYDRGATIGEKLAVIRFVVR